MAFTALQFSFSAWLSQHCNFHSQHGFHSTAIFTQAWLSQQCNLHSSMSFTALQFSLSAWFSQHYHFHSQHGFHSTAIFTQALLSQHCNFHSQHGCHSTAMQSDPRKIKLASKKRYELNKHKARHMCICSTMNFDLKYGAHEQLTARAFRNE